jgi:hypothetical protein
VFELPVEDIAIGHRSVNDTGQIALLLQVGGASPTTHIILATPRRTPQEITFPDLASPIFGGPPVPMTATASSGLPVTFAASGACALAAGAVTLPGAGNCTVTASQSGDSTYAPAPDLSQTLAVRRAPQAIDFGVVADLAFGSLPFTVSATASSGLPVAFSATGPCSLAGAVVTLAGAGACTLVASQNGSADYEPAPDVVRSLAVGRAGQTIAFAPLPDRTFGDPPFAVEAGASSGLPVAFTASQSGDANYLPAPDVTQAFAIARAAQTITFDVLPSRRLGDPPFALSAVASSGLPVAFSATGACAVSENVLSVTGAGLCTVTAGQAGDRTSSPPPPWCAHFRSPGSCWRRTSTSARTASTTSTIPCAARTRAPMRPGAGRRWAVSVAAR